ncbi:transforming growth factor-beta-induced protein ig-h3 isoform X2 [Drosophila sulfurigaster albostrigata]|uniref:transforming growth factor-beta-induced protein ig-h3 isoform X2 n=1 Tax=Drosophila sulfurigaster albostrigata TaxID=89887 RepID=UPI002D218782|nr:transforming growth factor-beta-induced protein ig-h3 isoform X2 [Drosophila sulfurigaster albostrigata]XP_062126523.1 transforming growth factor-beta-induced protein ig-h3 isoform X2 [Drosophila sulfurigaster albostrigata]XP_062126524.1 transforming growth factor-beta-induced protein ig-h3 isoform X2 [Drosophila sulfurigaster albostrigata]
MPKLWACLLLVSFVQAGPFYSDSSYGSDGITDTEFIPLEQQQQQSQGRQDAVVTAVTSQPHTSAQKPFNVDTITTDINSPNPAVFFQQSFPFFGNEFFNSFGGFGFGNAQEPWWKGPNVCTEKEESEGAITEADGDESVDTFGQERDGAGSVVRSPLFGQFHFSVNSCAEKPNKHVCTKIVNQNGKKKTLTLTRQCCHGYGRPRNSDFNTPCEKIEIKDIEATAADMGAKQFIASAKSAGELGDMLASNSGKKVTVFVPLDTAFQEYRGEHQQENNVEDSKTDTSKTSSIYKLHSVIGDVQLEDVPNEQLLQTELPGQKIRINSYQLPPGLEPYRYAANCVPIEKHDKLSEQALVHTLNGVLKPISKTVMDIIRDRTDLSIMRAVLEKTNISAMLEADKPVTIFVPTDAAFDKLDPHFRRTLKEGRSCASNILKYHMLDLTFCSLATLPGAKTTAYNLLGEPLLFNRTQHNQNSTMESAVYINNVAKILNADIMGTNGVLHVIDTIMPTESALPMTSLISQKNLTIFKQLLEASGFDDQFDDLDNVTIFAPTDKALQHSQWARLVAEKPETLKGNQDLLKFLNYHVVKPMIKTCDLSESSLPTVEGSSVRLNLYSTHALFSDVMNRATVNCARLVHFDDESCGSVLHQVDRALTPPQNNLLKSLEANPNYSKFLELVRKANLTHLLANESDSFTLLVPKNDVFDELSESNESKASTQSQAELEAQVKTHIVNDVVCCAGIIPTNWPFVRSIESISGQHLRITRDRRPKIENAGVTKCDVIATNGILHEINDVIVPRPSQQHRRPHLPPNYQSQGDFDVFF